LTDYTANAERGEVLIELRGKPYPMRPSYEAQVAIETRLGTSIEDLWVRSARFAEAMFRGTSAEAGDRMGAILRADFGPNIGLKLTELAVIVCEFMRAAGREREDVDLKATAHEKTAELLAEIRMAAYPAICTVLNNALSGGASPKE